MNPTPTPLEEIVKEFREQFGGEFDIAADEAGEPNMLDEAAVFLTSKLAAAYNAGILKAREAEKALVPTLCKDCQKNCYRRCKCICHEQYFGYSNAKKDFAAALDKLLLPTDKPNIKNL